MKQKKSLRLTAMRQLSIGISIGIALIAVLAITAIASSTTLPDTQLEQGYTKESLEASSLTAPYSPAGPVTLTWTTVVTFFDPRTNSGVEGSAANVIGDKLYVSHGFRDVDSNLFSFYDILSDTWTHGGPDAPDATVPRSELGGGTVNGKHYAVGGRTGPSADVEVFDPATSSWMTATSMSLARGGLGVASWGGKIYAIGGRGGNTFGEAPIYTKTEVYSPASNNWTTLAPMPIPVSDNYATVAMGGKIYVFGGATDPSTVISATQIYDIRRDSWSLGAPMPTARAAGMVGTICGDTIAVFGGYDPLGIGNLDVTELYSPHDDSWSTGPNMQVAASEIGQGVTTYKDRTIFSVGSGIFGLSGSVVQRLDAECRYDLYLPILFKNP
ncbi:MAG TPA: hypothetical protein DEP47_03150 [Chloroflexi bacterium]|nr:hypothetical protein [Chloroflexota bacterium]